MVNFVAKTILRVATRYEGHQSKSEEVYNSARNMFLMAFLNAAVVIQLVYFDWSPEIDMPLALQEYDQFSQEWYTEVGSTIVITLMLMVVSPHLSNLAFQGLYACTRCWDRGCRLDRRRTKKLVQADYENINTGSEFMLEFRYSNLLVVLAVAFLYSGGLPIMYPTAFVFFFITYWMDKCLLLSCYRRPYKFDNYLAKRTLGYFKLILLLHVCGFLLMYGFTPILQNDLFEHLEPGSIGTVQEDELNLFSYYFWFLAFLLAAYVIWKLLIGTCVKIGRRYCSETAKFKRLQYGF